LQPQCQLSFRICDLLITLEQILPKLFVLALQALVFTLDVLRLYRLLSARLAMRMPSNIYIARSFSQYPGPSLRFLKISATRLLQYLNYYLNFAMGKRDQLTTYSFIEGLRDAIARMPGNPLKVATLEP
jgi:hypothetical protein